MEKTMDLNKFKEIIKSQSGVFDLEVESYLLGNGTSYGVSLLIKETKESIAQEYKGEELNKFLKENELVNKDEYFGSITIKNDIVTIFFTKHDD